MKIEDEKFELNLKFYFLLKNLVKIKFSPNQITAILNYIFPATQTIEPLKNNLDTIINSKTKTGIRQRQDFERILEGIQNDIECKLLSFSIRLFSIKDLLLELAKLRQFNNNTKLQKLDPLSLEYDKLTIYKPYSTRVEGALLSLLLFDSIENGITIFEDKFGGEYINVLTQLAKELKQSGIESNQIFMLMFNESINQSIISDSGSNYEERIHTKLIDIGIDKDTISKKHDENDSSTEFDFFFSWNQRTYGIGAKRTLRERYKQFIKTSHMSDLNVMIEITLGLDLTEEKVKAIRNHGVYLIVADEIYQQFEYLREIEGVYSARQLNLELLRNLK